jgi:hypothetical protein
MFPILLASPVLLAGLAAGDEPQPPAQNGSRLLWEMTEWLETHVKERRGDGEGAP